MKRKNIRPKSESINTEEISKLRKLVKNMPEIRQDKVENVKRQIEAGTYNVSAESVAESIANLCQDLLPDKSCRCHKKTP